ncbi:MAG: zinc ribbon domain-containing protein [Desulfobacteraceae bacterium]
MICPKCHHEQRPDNVECVKCGVIFAKYAAAQQARMNAGHRGSADPSPPEEQNRTAMADVFFYINPDSHMFFLIGRCIVFVVLIFWGIRFVFSPLEDNYAGQSFMHLVNLPFHEAGHIFFRILGSFMTSLGGTIGQFLMPLVCFAVFLFKTRDTFGASAALWWFGQNFFDIAPYINDARSLSLPLLGGNTGLSSPYGFHDWEYLLTESGLLRYDHFIAKLCVFAGTVTFILSFAWGGILLYKQYRNLKRQ